MTEPRVLVERIESAPELPEGASERFFGYGVMACPFSAGDILCLRRFPASSVGPGYTSVWHWTPNGRWAFYQDVPPRQACPRFFGSAIAEASEVAINLRWTADRAFQVSLDAGTSIEWEVELAPTAVTRAMNVIGGLMPDRLWSSKVVLSLMASVAGVALRAGRLGLAGRAPNGQRFVANPLLVWSISASRASVAGRDLGVVASAPAQPRLGDFWIPRRGLFAIGRAVFEPFDAARHLSSVSQAGRG
jgi:hypothetical protein